MIYPKIEMLLQQNRFSEAEAAIREQIGKSVDDEYLFFLLGLVMLSQNKPREAEKAGLEAIRLNAEFDLGFYLCSRAQLDQGKKGEALTSIETAIGLDPYDADYFCQKAQIFLERKKYEETLKAAEEGLAINPDHEECRILRSITLERMGRHDEAEGESLGILADDPDAADSHILRGWVLAERNDTKGAEHHFLEALRIQADHPGAREGLTFIYKLKHPLLGWALKVLLWIEKFPFWLAIVGIFLVMRFGDKIADSDLPQPLPFLGVILRVFIYSFFVIALLVQPLFDVLLWISKSTRHALSAKQVTAVKWAIVPVIISMIYLVLFIISMTGRMVPIHAVIWAALAALIFEIFESSNLTVKRCMTGLVILCLAVIIFIESYTYGYLMPRVTEFRNSLLAAEGNKEELQNLAKEFSSTLKNSFRYLHLPALTIWLLAAFSDYVRMLFERKFGD